MLNRLQYATPEAHHNAAALFADYIARSQILQGRADAVGETLFLQRELEFASAQSYDVLVDPKIGRTIVPMNWSIPEGAESYTYQMLEGVTKAEWITNWATLVGRADVTAKEYVHLCRSFQTHFAYSYQDLQNAAFGKKPVDRLRAKFARIGIEDFLDDLIAIGDASRGIKGITNHPNMPEVPVVVGEWDADTTAEEIFKDLNALAQAPEQATAGLFVADTLALPLKTKPFLAKPYSEFIPESVLSVWLKSQQDVKTVKFWNRLNAVADDSNHMRAIAFKSSPEVIEFMGSYDYKEFPPIQSGLAYQVPINARVLGLVMRYPLATAFMDLDSSPA